MSYLLEKVWTCVHAEFEQVLHGKMKSMIALGVGIGTIVILKRWIKGIARRRMLRNAVMKLNKRRSVHFQNLEHQLEDGLSDSTRQVVLDKRDYIVQLTLRQLIDELSNHQLTATQVLQAYQAKALEAQQKTNCICWFITEAEDWAAKLDQDYGGSNQEQMPPLFGVPVSIKETVMIEGYISTRGYAASLETTTNEAPNVAADDATIVTVLKQLGAVPFCTTNVPQSLLSFTCSNPIYGVTNHAADTARTPGGSSGGEAALIACGASILGIGSDVGGSLRIPAHFSGIAGLKPTSRRFPQSGSCGSIPGRPMVYASLGPMARDVESMKIFMEILYSHSNVFSLDRSITPIPFNEDSFSGASAGAIKIGYFKNLDLIPAAPTCQRAVELAKEKLESMGYELVPMDAQLMNEGFSHFAGMTLLDGGAYLLDNFDRDLVDPHHASIVRLYRMPLVLGKLFAPLLGRLVSPVYEVLAKAIPTTTSQLRSNYEGGENWCRRVLQYLQNEKIEVLICPVNAMVAPFHGTPGRTLLAAGYTSIFNVLDFPAMSYPISHVNQSDLVALESDYPASDPMTRAIKESCRDTLGFPVGVQLVALPFCEETLLRVAMELEKLG